MSLTRNIARILGPTLIAIAVTEGINLDAFAGNPAPVVYLDGTVLFIVTSPENGTTYVEGSSKVKAYIRLLGRMWVKSSETVWWSEPPRGLCSGRMLTVTTTRVSPTRWPMESPIHSLTCDGPGLSA